MATFTPDTTARLAASDMSIRTHNKLCKGYNSRTNTGWFKVASSGSCTCGKAYIAGDAICYQYGKVSGCVWCCDTVAPTATDVANYNAFRAEIAALPAPERTEMAMCIKGALSAMGGHYRSYRELIAEVAGANEQLRQYAKEAARPTPRMAW
jgi:hypothetical protein